MGIVERQNHFKLNEGKGQVRVKPSKWMQIHMQEMEFLKNIACLTKDEKIDT